MHNQIGYFQHFLFRYTFYFEIVNPFARIVNAQVETTGAGVFVAGVQSLVKD